MIRGGAAVFRPSLAGTECLKVLAAWACGSAYPWQNLQPQVWKWKGLCQTTYIASVIMVWWYWCRWTDSGRCGRWVSQGNTRVTLRVTYDKRVTPVVLPELTPPPLWVAHPWTSGLMQDKAVWYITNQLFFSKKGHCSATCLACRRPQCQSLAFPMKGSQVDGGVKDFSLELAEHLRGCVES